MLAASLSLTGFAGAAPLEAHPLESCDLCFSMRAGDRWVTRSAADELRLGGAERLSFWRVYPRNEGQWPEFVLFEGTIPSRDGYRAVRVGDGGSQIVVPFDASWSTCGGPECAGFLYHATSPGAFRDWTSDGTFPATSAIGACEGANCSYIAEGAGGALVLGPAERATEFEFVCEPCPDGIGGAALHWAIAFLSVVGSIPSVLALSARMQRRGVETPLVVTAWPAAKRSAYVWAVMQVCWLMVVGGTAPTIFWAVRAASSSDNDGSRALSILGLAGILMGLRDDDPPAVLRAASVLVTCAAVAGMLLALGNFQSDWELLAFAPADGGGAAAAATWPLRTAYSLSGAIWPSIVGSVLAGVLCAALAAAQLPLHRPGARRLRGGEALRWLWLTTRVWALLVGVVCLAISAAAGVAALACPHAYPSERRRARRLLGLLLPLAASFLLAAAVTTPGVRMRLHLAHIRGLRHALFVPRWRRIAAHRKCHPPPPSTPINSAPYAPLGVPEGMWLAQAATYSFSAALKPRKAQETLLRRELKMGSRHFQPTGIGRNEPFSAVPVEPFGPPCVAPVFAVPSAASSPPPSEGAARGGDGMDLGCDGDGDGDGDGVARGSERSVGSMDSAKLGDVAFVPRSLAEADAYAAARPRGLSLSLSGGSSPPGNSQHDMHSIEQQWAGVDLGEWARRTPPLEGSRPGFENLEVLAVLGRGGFGAVFLARAGGREVAVKIFLRNENDASQAALLWRELELNLALSPHPCVVRVLGSCVVASAPALVMDLMLGGSLYDLLHRPRRSDARSKEPWDVRDLALEAAEGLAHLHLHGIAHRDVKSPNVLLTADRHAAISDFGLATRFGMEHSAGVGTYRYMAPEVLFGTYDERADTFSYGVLLWETLHAAVPFASLTSAQALVRIQQGARPAIELPPERAGYAGLIAACWDQRPERRPALPALVSELRVLREA